MDFTLMKDFMDRLTAWRIPGNSISIQIGNREVFSYQSGYENVEKQIKMGNDKLFNIYSCTKVATVVAAMQLYEKGFFLLDDPLYDFIPEYRNMNIKDADGNLSKAKNIITLRHLFTMTSGLSYNFRIPPIEKARELTKGQMDTLTVARCVAEEPLLFEPGERWQYAKNHDILAAVVEVISGMKFRDYVKKNIFEPLEIKDAYFHNENVLDRVCEQYHYKLENKFDIVQLQSDGMQEEKGVLENVGKRVSHILGPEYDSGGAGLTVSVPDYSKFLSALANGGVGATSERIISSRAIELLRTKQLDENQKVSFTWSQLRGYNYGLGVRTLENIAQSGTLGNIGEFGWGGAAGATALVDPALNLSMFYTHHMLNPQEDYYQPRLRNVLYACINEV